MVECNQEKLKESCPCTYSSCSRIGKCCECIQYHLRMDELPGCVFAKVSKEAERSYDRTFKNFARLVMEK